MRFLSFTTLKIVTVVVSALGIVTFVALCSSNNPVTVKVAAGTLRGGAEIYAQSCARCHGADGRARTAKGKQVGASDFTSSEWEPDVERDTRIVTKGKGSMPSFKRKLTPADIAAVVAYIRRFKS